MEVLFFHKHPTLKNNNVSDPLHKFGIKHGSFSVKFYGDIIKQNIQGFHLYDRLWGQHILTDTRISKIRKKW